MVPLTTVAQPSHQIGRAAVELLLAQAQGTLGPGSRDRVLEPELVVRDSTRLSRTIGVG